MHENANTRLGIIDSRILEIFDLFFKVLSKSIYIWFKLYKNSDYKLIRFGSISAVSEYERTSCYVQPFW